MEKPDHIVSFETPLATCWVENDILCVITNNAERTKKDTEQHYKILKGILKQKYFWLIELRLCKNMNRDVLDTIYNEIPEVCRGMAVIAVRPCEKLVAGYFLRLEESGIPSKRFESEGAARKWIRGLH